MWLLMVSGVMVSALGYIAILDGPDLTDEDSGWRVVEDETESSTSSDRDGEGSGEDSLMEDRDSDLSTCFDRIFWAMRF